MNSKVLAKGQIVEYAEHVMRTDDDLVRYLMADAGAFSGLRAYFSVVEAYIFDSNTKVKEVTRDEYAKTTSKIITSLGSVNPIKFLFLLLITNKVKTVIFDEYGVISRE